MSHMICGLTIQLHSHCTSQTLGWQNNPSLMFRIIFEKLSFQIQNTQQQQVINSTNQRQPTAGIGGTIVEDINPVSVIEEIIVEDVTVPERVAQEIIIKGGNINYITAGPYNGYLQGPL